MSNQFPAHLYDAWKTTPPKERKTVKFTCEITIEKTPDNEPLEILAEILQDTINDIEDSTYVRNYAENAVSVNWEIFS